MISTLLTLLILQSSSVPEWREVPRTEWIQLFNGRDLEGWDVKIRGYELNDNFGETFRVSDGKLQVGYEAYDRYGDRFGHIFHRQKYSHYVLAVEYRFTGEQVPGGPGWALRNSGAMVHSQPAASMLRDQDFPISIEVQFLGGSGSGDRPTANLCTPGTHVQREGELFTQHCLNSDSETFHGDRWVRVEIEVLGSSRIRHFVEGVEVLSYDRPQIGGGSVAGHDEAVKKDGQLLSEGHIVLQSESHPIEFRKVEILDLRGCRDPEASNFKSYAVEDDRSLCRD